MEAIIPILIVFFIIVTLLWGIRIVHQQEALIVERLGKYNRTLYAGLRFIIPYLENIRAKVSLKEQVMNIEKQDVITKDNAIVSVDAVAYYQIVSPEKAVYNIENLEYAIIQTVQTNLRDIIGGMTLDEVLQSREKINMKIRETLQGVADDWGIIVKRTEVKEIKPPKNIVDAMTKQMEAERNKRAMITEAEGKKQAEVLEAEGYKLAKYQEAEAIERLGQAQANAVKALKEIIDNSEIASQFLIGDRFVSSLKEIANSNNSKIIVLPPNVENIFKILNENKK
ncbi:SPFH domain-containing protein [Hydrogenothermus marinus]|uniref:SPFH domain-containing protein n=1 Tax=Hydrogenothermus marinus TaxID=133270 RepID=A0A3M0BSC6_9AQUI|nr:SPFH domain-containing protein [Hydrogenothermus marinus]RMA97738.1 SPFH domain-containing protein [Hydrogenothermus marinus]